MAANGYPGAYDKGSVIKGLEDASRIATSRFFTPAQCGEMAKETATGGRVIAVTALGAPIAEAQSLSL